MPFRTLIVLLAFSVLSFAVCAQNYPTSKLHGYVFGDYFYKLGGNAPEISPSQYSNVEKDFQAFQLRRLYLYYDVDISEKFFTQFLLEGNDKTLDPGGRHSLFIKTAYLEWKEIIPMGNLRLGLIPTPTWPMLTEQIWNYRSIEKTIMDYRGFGAASDIGVELHGKFDPGGKFNYVAMIGNGNGQKPETNKYKKYYGSLSMKPTKEIIVEGYFDYEPGLSGRDKTTLRGFAAYQSERITTGVELFQQNQVKLGAGGTDRTPVGLDLFAWGQLTSDLNAFARFDYYNPDTKASGAGFKESFFVFGLDYMPMKNVHFMPNLWMNTFSDKSPANLSKDADVVARVTFFYLYE